MAEAREDAEEQTIRRKPSTGLGWATTNRPARSPSWKTKVTVPRGSEDARDTYPDHAVSGTRS